MQFDIFTVVVALVSVLLSMTIHEAVHAYTSYALGDHTAKDEGRLTLNPIAHIDPIATVAIPVFLAAVGAPIFGAAKPVPFNPENLKWGDFGAATVALAGPFSNLVMAALAGVGIMLGADGILLNILVTFTLVNIGFFVFNMIPFPPLDGSRFLYAVAPEFVRSGMRAIESLGIMAIFIFIIVFYMFLTEPFRAVVSALFNALTGGRVNLG